MIKLGHLKPLLLLFKITYIFRYMQIENSCDEAFEIK